MRLLVVDDSSIIRSRIAKVAMHPSMRGMQIVGLASNGREAVEMAAETRPSVVTMDLTMPEMGGVACVEALMRIDSSLRILVVSALSDKPTAIQAIRKGARGFLNKPFTDEQLVAALHQISA